MKRDAQEYIHNSSCGNLPSLRDDIGVSLNKKETFSLTSYIYGGISQQLYFDLTRKSIKMKLLFFRRDPRHSIW